MLVSLEAAVIKEKNINHFIGLSMGPAIVAGAFGAGAVPGGYFNLAVVTGLEGASIHLGFGFCFVGVFRCRLLVFVGLEASVAKAAKNNHFRPFTMGHFIFAGTHGADAVSGDCSNLAGALASMSPASTWALVIVPSSVRGASSGCCWP